MATTNPFPPAAPGAARGLSWKRLGGVTLVLGLFLAAGTALAWVCSSLNEEYAEKQQRGAAGPAETAKGGSANVPPAATSPALIRLPDAQQAEVNQAVIRAIRFLKTSQMASGTWSDAHKVGYAALPGLTLLECGVPASDPNIQKAAAFVRSQVATVNTTYELSLAILFLDRLDDRADEKHIQTLALRLLAGQYRTGGWWYACPILSPPAAEQLLGVLASAEASPGPELHKITIAQPLHGEISALPVLKDLAEVKPEQFKQFEGDNSNTQFAILALWVARRHKVPLEHTAARVVERFRHSQHENGSWFYGAGQYTTPSTTCAGLLGLAIGQGVAADRTGKTTRPLEDAALKKALAFLGNSIGQPAGAGKGKPAPVDLYFLWSLERVAVLYGLQTIAGKDWYAWGADALLANQQPKGDFLSASPHSNIPVINTCFGLLILVQANLAKDLTSKLQLLGGR
jgi:hypothetical protein